MREQLITSGRMNLGVDPVLHAWHWPIPFYLFLGGLAAGLLFFAAYKVLAGKEKDFPTAVMFGPVVALAAIVIGLMALIYDLHHPFFAWQLFTTFRIESPMSWGAWTLMVASVVNAIWIFSYLKKMFPKFDVRNPLIKKLVLKFVVLTETDESINWEWKHKFVNTIEDYSIQWRKAWAWVMIILAVILGVYTGILLSAFNARPLWNTALLGPLFLTSGLSTGAALLMIMSKTHYEKITFSKIDILLIVIELFFITHMFMGFLAGSEVKAEAAHYFMGGEFTITFWVNVIIIGLVVPAILEVLELLDFKIPVIIPGLMIIWGGMMFRFIMVDAGQVIRFLY